MAAPGTASRGLVPTGDKLHLCVRTGGACWREIPLGSAYLTPTLSQEPENTFPAIPGGQAGTLAFPKGEEIERISR